ncbi:EAL domain-containing protein [Ammoniphilus sp. CFH 90114]|uniref:EAL domain-containing protein n=1 Tax=Ammoniphilus sp. CFH 90114 TaxID=2493665 RepID=UPI00100E49B5|nr:EAL domain-containing protein [Ammoniphilus sp. CFH 90114]RXT15272.1 EAL domain-containing protein [Ammoniphilus sp. CFH 90114]
MSICSACFNPELIYQIRFDGVHNTSFIPQLLNYLRREKALIEAQAEVVHLKEHALLDLIDFCRDHMDLEYIFFRVDNQDWKPLIEAQAVYENQWIDDIIREGQVTSYFQPIVNQEEQVVAYELLSRFYGQDGNLRSPGEVFKAAKKRNRLYAIDRLCRMTAVRNSARINVMAFINFLPTSIYSPSHCLQSTIRLAEELGVKPTNLVFEVVESEKVDDIEHLKSILTYYKKQGFQYALDDVGEGFSTIELLRELSPGYMKLDMKYVHGVASDSMKQLMAKRLLKAAQEIGSVPLAEGIETREDFLWLRDVGFELFQGYLFGKPLPQPLPS